MNYIHIQLLPLLQEKYHDFTNDDAIRSLAKGEFVKGFSYNE